MPTSRHSYVFTVRLWADCESGQPSWQGKVHYLSGNQVRHFGSWALLVPTLVAMLRDAQRQSPPPPTSSQ